jgi:hypothetical protein
MKNFSTGAAALAAAWLLAGSAQAVDNCAFRPNAPDQHVVVKHDTLWDISGTFLEHPWCWPQVWGMNRDEIRNPHWIYPGQIIYFDRAHGRLTLTRPQAAGADDGQPPLTRLSPQIRTEAVDAARAVPAIPPAAIEPYLTRPLVIEPGALAQAPRIAASREDHVNLGEGDRIYVRGELGNETEFQVFRPGKELRDPDTNKVVAHEAGYLGVARLVARAGNGVDVHTFEITRSVLEIGIGDRLLPMPPSTVLNYVPHAPAQPVRARVMSIASESRFAAQSQVVAVNRGALDGLDVGAVLQLYHAGQTVTDPGSKGFFGFRKSTMRLPDEQLGNLFIFRVFGHVSYGLVMQVTAPVQIGDVATSPE